jgi:hypothetical protein
VQPQSVVTNIVAQSVVVVVVQAFNTPPFYLKGLEIVIAFAALMIPMAAGGSIYVKWINAKKTTALSSGSEER